MLSTTKAILVSMRPKQWTKNLIIFAAIIFSQNLNRPVFLAKVILAFILFSFLSGAVYIFNDLKDLEKDKMHQKKRKRPLPSGQLNSQVALITSSLVALFSLGISLFIEPLFGLVALSYFLLQICYTFYLKEQVIFDVMTIAAGFVLRAIAGAVVISVRISPWLLLCAALLALFLGLAKRRHELVLLENNASNHRPILEEYSITLLDEMISMVTSATIVTYALYTFFSETAAKSHYLMATIPFVIYGLFRYLYLMHQKNLGGSPEEILLTDGPLVVDIILWLITVCIVLYLG
jgi:4-hydroxybenzoate polyprenyltransferase